MNLWAFVSLFVGLLHLSLGVFAIHKNRKKPLNITFFVFALSLAIWGISEFGHRITNDPDMASILIKLSGLGWCFMASLWIHFTLIFARKDKILRRKTTYIALYAPFMAIFYLTLTTDLIYKQKPEKTFYGYTTLPGEFLWVYMLLYTLLYLMMMYLFWTVMKSGTNIEKRQFKPMFWGATSFLILGTLTNVIFPVDQVYIPELGTVFSLSWAVSIFYAVIRHRLFIVEPSVEEFSDAPKMYPLEEGHVYILKEEYPTRGYEIFYDQITHGNFGLCITKLLPDNVRQKYGLAKTPIIYSAFDDADNVILPKNTDVLFSIIAEFRQKTTNSIFLLTA